VKEYTKKVILKKRNWNWESTLMRLYELKRLTF
jgi:hypothetical protein